MSTSLPENVPPLKNLRISQCSPALAARPATSFSRHQVQEQQTQAGCLATMLPIEVLLDVFKRLDLRSLGRSACGTFLSGCTFALTIKYVKCGGLWPASTNYGNTFVTRSCNSFKLSLSPLGVEFLR